MKAIIEIDSLKKVILKKSMKVYQLGYIDDYSGDFTMLFLEKTFKKGECVYSPFIIKGGRMFATDKLGGFHNQSVKYSGEYLRGMSYIYLTERLEDEFIDTHTPVLAEFIIPAGGLCYKDGTIIYSEQLMFTGNTWNPDSIE